MRTRASSLSRSSLDAADRLFHDLDNSVSALALILGVVRSDSTCMWAQGNGLDAMAKTLVGLRLTVRKLKGEKERCTVNSQVSKPAAASASAAPEATKVTVKSTATSMARARASKK